MKRAVLVVALSLLPVVSQPQEPTHWPDTFESRAEMLRLLRSLDAELLAASSATRTLETWCGDHHMADVPKIVAKRTAGAAKAPSPEQLARLGVRDASEVWYRHVELRCGAHVLSEADNWYVPARLTAEMNASLDTTETPFGTVVRPLRPYRCTIAATMLWVPLPRVFEQHPWVSIPRDVLQHRAVLYTAGSVPFAEVVETYRGELLDFTRP